VLRFVSPNLRESVASSPLISGGHAKYYADCGLQ
jgi:hypothetical protein